MKILVTDADGTITFKNHIIGKLDIKAMTDFKNESPDNILILATGRNLAPAKMLLDENNFYLFDYYILSNGAIILDREFNEIYMNPITFDTKQVCDLFENHYRLDTKIDHHFTKSYHSSTNFPVKILKILDQNKPIKQDIFVVSTRCLNEQNREILVDKLNNLNLDLQVIVNNLDIDVSNIGVDKATAITYLVDYLKLSDYDLFTIGDSYNDLKMIKMTQNGATFTYANSDIKQSASIIVSSMDEYINTYIINK